MKFLLSISMNALTVAALYFLVASGFSLIFGLLRSVNMAHGALYLLGGDVGYEVATLSGSWLVGLAGATVFVAIVGWLMHQLLIKPLGHDELRQALVTIGCAVVIGDLLLMRYGGATIQFEPPAAIFGSTPFPVLGAYPTIRLFVVAVAVLLGATLWLLIHHTRLGMLIRAGVDDREMVGALGFPIARTMAGVFAAGAGLAGLAGVVGGSALSVAPGEDARYLLSSLVVVIVGGMGSLSGAAVGALLIGFTEQFGIAYFPNYAMLLTFVLMVAVLAIKPAGLFGRPA
jgi:branched-chain amino acid transport system permease protein